VYRFQSSPAQHLKVASLRREGNSTWN